MLISLVILNFIVFLLISFFIFFRLKRIKNEINKIVESKNLLKQEKNLNFFIIFSIIFCFILVNIYLFTFF